MRTLLTSILLIAAVTFSNAQCDTLISANDTGTCVKTGIQLDLSSFVVKTGGTWSSTTSGIIKNNVLSIKSISKDEVVTYTHPNVKMGCPDKGSFTIKANALPIPIVDPQLPYSCENHDEIKIDFYGNPRFGGKGIWFDTSSTQHFVTQKGSSFYFNPQKAGADGQRMKIHHIFFKYTDANGCSDSISAPIGVKPLPVLKLTHDTIHIHTSDTFRNLDQYIVNYKGGSWLYPNDPSSVKQMDLNNDSKLEYVFDSRSQSPGYKVLWYSYVDTKSQPAPYCQDSARFVINLSKQWPVSAKETSRARFSIYPNPTQGKFTISSGFIGSMKIFTPTGSLVYEATLLDTETTFTTSLNKGVYLVQISEKSGNTHVQKLHVY